MSRCELFQAIENSDYELVDSLITKGVEVNCVSINGESPLHLALEKGSPDIALLLISSGFDVNQKNSHDKTPLFIASQSNNLTVVRALLNRSNLSVNLYCNEETPLHVACAEGHLDVVKELVNNYRTMFWVNVRYQQDLPLHVAISKSHSEITLILLDKMTSVNSLDKDGRTPLWLALSKKDSQVVQILLNNYRVNPNFKYEGNAPVLFAISQHMIEEVKCLVEKGASIQAKNVDKRTVLHLSVLEGMHDLVKYFIDKGADIYAIDSRGFIPFHCAVTQGDIKMTTIFLNNGINVDYRVNNNASDGHTALQLAVKRGNFEIAKFLIEHGANVNARDPQTHYARNRGGTLLHWACRQYLDGFKTVKFLVENRANINAEADDGRTPLCLAIKHGFRIEDLKYLIDSGASLNTNRGGTPLYWAFYMRYNHIAEFLIENGVDVNLPVDNFDDEWIKRTTPLHTVQDLSVAKLLIKKGAHVNALDKDGNTPLHNVCCLAIAKCLVENGADVTICNFQGDTPLHKAQNAHIAEFLIENGLHVNSLNHKGYSPLHTAKNVYIAQLLIDNGADVNIVTKEGRNVLHTIAECDLCSADLVDYFVEKGVDPNSVDKNGDTPLKLSSICFNHEVSSKLLNNGATSRLFNVETNGYDGYYLKWLNELFVELKSDLPGKKSMSLVRSHLPLNYKDSDTKSTALHIAAQYGKKHFVDQVLNIMPKNIQNSRYCNKINVNARDVNGLTPLHVAALKNQKDIVCSLLKSGAIYNAKTFSGERPIDLTESVDIQNILNKVKEAFSAIQDQNFDKLRKYVDLEENIINALDEEGFSLLQRACLSRCSESISFLLEKGVNISLVNRNKQTVLHLAASVDDHHLVSTFFNVYFKHLRNASRTASNKMFDRKSLEFSLFFDFVNLRDVDDRTALHIASNTGSFEMVKTLIKFGVMFDSKDKLGKTALDLSSEERITHVLKSTEAIFNNSKSGSEDIINNLKNSGKENNLVTILTSNRFGESLTDFLTINGHAHIAKLVLDLKLLNLPEEICSSSENTNVTSLEPDDGLCDSDLGDFGLFD